MKEKTKIVYYCGHCKKHGLVKYLMEYHEQICFKNPENNRPCFNCVHLVNKKNVSFTSYNYNTFERSNTYNVFFCLKKDVCLYTPQSEIRGNYLEFDDYSNEPMPKECEFYTQMF
jgi:hypothetical protein